jgi:hypothetical protein
VSLTSQVQSETVSLTCLVSGELQMETLILSTATWFALHQKELTNILEECSLKWLSARAHKYSRRMICRKTLPIFQMSARAGLAYNYSRHECSRVFRIRIRNLAGQNFPPKREKLKKFHVLRVLCWAGGFTRSLNVQYLI